MENKKATKISLSTFFLILAIIVIVIMSYYIYNLNNEKKSEISKVSELNSQISSLENTKNLNVSYIVLEVEDTDAKEGLAYKNKKITDKEKINLLMKIVDSAESYEEKSFIADFGDAPPSATIYLTNGEKYSISAGDEINDNGDTVNLMTKWNSNDGSGKTLYKVNMKLGEYIEKLYRE